MEYNGNPSANTSNPTGIKYEGKLEPTLTFDGGRTSQSIEENGNLFTIPITVDGYYRLRLWMSDEAGNEWELDSDAIKWINVSDYLMDATAPAISGITRNDVTQMQRIAAGVLSRLTFGGMYMFFRDADATYTVQSGEPDNGSIGAISGLARNAEYLRVPVNTTAELRALQEHGIAAELLSGKNWTSFTGDRFTVNEGDQGEFRGIYLVRYVDNAGHTTVYTTDGYIVDLNEPSEQTVAFTGITGYADAGNPVNGAALLLTTGGDLTRDESAYGKWYEGVRVEFTAMDAQSGIHHVELTLVDENNSPLGVFDENTGERGAQYVMNFYPQDAAWAEEGEAYPGNGTLIPVDMDGYAEGKLFDGYYTGVFTGSAFITEPGRYGIKLTAYDNAGYEIAVTDEQLIHVDKAPRFYVNKTTTGTHSDDNANTTDNFREGAVNKKWTNGDVTLDLVELTHTFAPVTYWFSVDGGSIQAPDAGQCDGRAGCHARRREVQL